jgi:two-component system cell cycle sensor histidine kinase/response regulator CckA
MSVTVPNESGLSRSLRRALIVVDSPADAELMINVLKRAGYQLSFEVASEPETFRARALSGECDFILSEHRLRTWTGFEALKLLQEAKRDIPFIVVTGASSVEAAVEYLKAGAADYLQKRRLGRLPAAVEKALSERPHREKTDRRDLVLPGQHQWELTFDSVPGPIFLLDEKMLVRRANRAAVETFQWSLDEIIGRPCYQVIHGQDEPCVGCPHADAREAGQARRADLPDNRLNKIFDMVCSPLHDSGGQFSGFILTMQDVTERRRAEKSLRDSESQYRMLFEGNPHSMWVFDRETLAFLAVNDAAVAHYGYTREEFLRMTLKDIRPPEDIGPLLDYLAKSSTGIQMAGEWRHRRKDGAILNVMVTIHPITFVGKSALLELAEDITGRKRAEEQIRKLSRAVEQSPVSILIADRRGDIEYVNPKFTAATGYTLDEVRGQNTRVLRFGETQPEEYRELWETITSGGEWRGEFHNRKKDGTLLLARASISPIRDESGTITHFLGVEEDITAQRLLEEQLRRAQKMEAVGRLAAGIAHDFNNLLTVISGRSDLLCDKLEPGGKLRDSVEEIRKAADRAAGLTRQLLAFSRQQILQPQILDLNVIVSRMDKLLLRLIREDIELRTAYSKDLGLIKADPSQIEQVVMNLAVNARDAMPRGGKLTIETSNVTLGSAYAGTHLQLTPGPYVLLAVSDTGIGMDEATKSRIFEPFFTTKEQGKGTGLGLATVYGIVKQSGGYIWVYSEAGQGTTFKVYFPQAGVPAVPAADSSSQPHTSPQGDETILVAEDEAPLRRMVVEILESSGYRVLEAANGIDALKVAAGHAQPIHLLLTDIVMPGMGGRELAERMSAAYPKMKVLFTSGYTNDAVIRYGVLGAGAAFLQKPFSPQAVGRKVREVLDAR